MILKRAFFVYLYGFLHNKYYNMVEDCVLRGSNVDNYYAPVVRFHYT